MSHLLKRIRRAASRSVHLTEKVAKASIDPTHKNISGAKTEVKQVTRNIARVSERPMVYATGGITAAATYFLTPVGGVAAGAAGSELTGINAGIAARAKGKHGRAARHESVVYRKRAITAAGIGLGVGGLGAGIGATVAGSAQAAGVNSGAAAIVGASNVATVSTIGSLSISAAQKIVPQVIAAEQKQSTTSSSASPASSPAAAGISLTLPGGDQAGAPSSPAPAESKVPWVPIVLTGLGLAAVA